MDSDLFNVSDIQTFKNSDTLNLMISFIFSIAPKFKTYETHFDDTIKTGKGVYFVSSGFF